MQMSDPFKAITGSIESNRRFFVKHKVEDAKENLRTSQQNRLLANVVGSVRRQAELVERKFHASQLPLCHTNVGEPSRDMT